MSATRTISEKTFLQLKADSAELAALKARVETRDEARTEDKLHDVREEPGFLTYALEEGDDS